MNSQRTAFEKIISLGQRYKSYRKVLGISQQVIHRKTGVAMSTISLFENGKGQGLSLEHFFLLMEAVDLSVDNVSLIPEAQKTDLASLWEQQNKKGRK
jgi:transcriptional regulator with XRE-family HTH domain